MKGIAFLLIGKKEKGTTRKYVRKTEVEGDAMKFAKESCAEKFDAVISMGGDGTVNETVNGLAEQKHRPVFGIINNIK